MATSSIFAQVNINDKSSLKRFVRAINKSEKFNKRQGKEQTMTSDELQKYLCSEEKISKEKLEQIIYELHNDCFKEQIKTDDRFYLGEVNAFRICLDLLDKMGE